MDMVRIAFLATLLAIVSDCGRTQPPPPASDATGATHDRREAIAKCGVHNATLIDETVPNNKLYSIEFGPGFYVAQQSQFPHTGVTLGVRDPKVTHILLNFCPKCREAHRKYWAENP